MNSDPTETTSALDKTNVTMAPEQGLSSLVERGKPNLHASDNGESQANTNTLQPEEFSKDNMTASIIYHLKKEQILIACQKYKIDPTGRTVKDLRKLLSDAVKKHKTSMSTENLFERWQEEMRMEEQDIIHPIPTAALIDIPSTSFSSNINKNLNFNLIGNNKAASTSQYMSATSDFSNTSFANQPQANILNIPQETALVKLIKNWNISYSGGTDLYVFFNRVEIRAKSVNLPIDQITPALPYLLKDSALRWHEVNNLNIQSWEEFRTRIANFFLPKRYLAQLEATFYNRKQQSREKGRDYILDMLTIIQQHPVLRNQDHLDRIYDGLTIDYRLHLNRDRVETIDDLTTKVNEYEQLRAEEAKANRHTTHVMIENYDRSTHCWNCKKRGHNRSKCRGKQMLFCSHCGKDGTMTKNCDCKKIKIVPASQNQVHTTAPTFKNRYMLDVTIKDSAISALLDTGASLSYANEKIIPLLKVYGYKPIKTKNEILVADQSLVKGDYSIRVPITYDNKTTWHTLIALPNLVETVILGMDFLCSRNIRIELDGKLLKTETAT